jgi:hypothetical protein
MWISAQLHKDTVNAILWTAFTYKCTWVYIENIPHSYYSHKRSFFLLRKFAKIVWHETTINMSNTCTGNPFNAATTLPNLQNRKANEKHQNISIQAKWLKKKTTNMCNRHTWITAACSTPAETETHWTSFIGVTPFPNLLVYKDQVHEHNSNKNMTETIKETWRS